MKVLHLLKAEFGNVLALSLSAATAVGTWMFFLPGSWGTVGLFTMAACGVGTAVALMRRTPWCADDAFWRTRPVAGRTMFLVRSGALIVLLVVPVGLVAALALAGLGPRTVWTGIGLLGGGALVAAGGLAAVQAVGSRDRVWEATAWSLVVLPVVLSAILVSRVLEPPPAEWGRLHASALLTLAVLAAVAWLAWSLVGIGRRWRAALVGIGLASAALPWLHAGFNRALHLRGDAPPMLEGSLEPGDGGFLEPPLRVVGLAPGEVAAPRLLRIKGPQTPRGRTIFDGTLRGGLGSGRLGPGEGVDVFSDDHREFAAVMDLERVWGLLRERVPGHATWVPSDPGPARPEPWISLPTAAQFEDPGLQAYLRGERYRFEGLAALNPVAAGRLEAPVGRLDLESASVPSPGAIDVRLRWLRPVADPRLADRHLKSSVPPEVWGILLHGPSGTAYGTASLREGFGGGTGPAGILIRRTDLLLRFQLPGLETALLGLDAGRVLEESTLYLFVSERTGFIQASLE